MSDYQEFQARRARELTARTVNDLRALADRIERDSNRPLSPYSTRVTQAADIIHEVHTMLANLPLWSLIVSAHGATENPYRDEEN